MPQNDQPKTADDVKALVDGLDIRFIRFWFTDILGQLKSFSVGRDELEDAFEGGMGFDGSSITGFDQFNVGPELEFFLFRNERGTDPLDQGGYFDLTTLDAGSDVRRDIVLALERLGIHVEYTHHEVGPSQHEIDMRYAPALKMADDTMTYRITVKEYAMRYGWHATFMPKPLFGENGSGMHTHQSLFSGERNAFFDGDDQYYL